MSLAVLHVDTEYGWRGGQQQLAYLATALDKRAFVSAVVCQPDSSVTQFCRDHQLTCFPIRMRGEWDLLAAFRIARLCRQRGFTLLHLHSGHAVSIGLWAKLFQPKLKLVATRRVDFPLKHRIFSRIKYANPLLDKIVCVSEEIRRIMMLGRIDGSRLITIHSGVDLHKHANLNLPDDFRARLGIPAHALLVGTVAAMVAHKDYPTLLYAAKRVLQQHPDAIFCAVGDGPLYEAIQALAAELNLGGRFIFTGYRKDVGHFLKSFDLFVLSSQQEGLGTSILDAQAAGVPVIACASGGIPEMIQDGYNGRLVPKKHPQALAEAILELANDDQLQQRLAQIGLRRVADFSIEKTVDRYIALYQTLLQDAECQNF